MEWPLLSRPESSRRQVGDHKRPGGQAPLNAGALTQDLGADSHWLPSATGVGHFGNPQTWLSGPLPLR